MSNLPLFIYEICGYLAAHSDGRFTFADGDSNLKVGELVRDVDGVFAMQVPAPPPDMDTAVETYNIDFWARNKNTSVAYKDMRIIYELFHRAHHYSTDNFLISASLALGQPDDMDRDGEGGKLLRVGIQFITTSLIS